MNIKCWTPLNHNNLENDCTVDFIIDDDIDDWHHNPFLSLHEIICWCLFIALRVHLCKKNPCEQNCSHFTAFHFSTQSLSFSKNFKRNCYNITWFQAFVFFYTDVVLLLFSLSLSIFTSTVLCRARLEFVILLFRWWKRRKRSKMFIPCYILWSRQESKCGTDFVAFSSKRIFFL